MGIAVMRLCVLLLQKESLKTWAEKLTVLNKVGFSLISA
jgi:hypothetical protein